MRTRSLPVKLGAVTIAAALTLAACGSDDEATSEVTDTTEQATEAPETTEAPAEASETIVDIAAGNEDFSTLVTAVTEAELVETLSGEGPFTVFAPTNEAFDALPEGTLDTLLEDPTGDLASILTYHVVPSVAMSTDLTDGMEVETVNGETLTIGVSDEGVTVTDATGNTVNVVTADLEASNGVIHVIDGVLLPA